MKNNFVALLAAIYLFSGCASSRPSSSSASEEVAIGEKIHTQILSSFYPYTDPKVVEYVNRIGQSLAAQAERKDLPYRFTVLYNDKIYAASAPGGFVYLTTGLMNFIDNEAELAAVMAHEIGELQYSDPRLSKSRKVLESLTRTGAPALGAFGEIGALASLGLAMVNAMAESKDMTPEERMLTADRRALHYMAAADQDPQGLIDLLHKFLNANQQVTPYFFDYYQSRPITQERFQVIQSEFAKLPLQGRNFSTRRSVYQDLTRGIRDMYRT